MAITALEREHQKNEAIIAKGLENWVHMADALAAIRDSKSYKDVAGFDTFEDYCRHRWDMTSGHARRLIRGAEVRRRLPNPKPCRGGTVDGWRECVVRTIDSLVPTPSQPKVGKAAIKIAEERGKPLTSTIVREAWHSMPEAPKPKKNNTSRHREPPTIVEQVRRWTGTIEGITEVITSISDEDWDLNFKGFQRDRTKFEKCVAELYELL